MSLIKDQRPDVDKVRFYVKDQFESKYQLLINRREKVGVKHERIPKALVNYCQTINDVHEILEHYNPTKKRKALIVFDAMIADMKANKKLKLVIAELFMRGRELKISVVFISSSYFPVSKTIRLIVMHCFIIKILNK